MDKIEAKRKEIEHYEGVLERYQSGRWLDMGRRHLVELKAELAELENNGAEVLTGGMSALQAEGSGSIPDGSTNLGC